MLLDSADLVMTFKPQLEPHSRELELRNCGLGLNDLETKRNRGFPVDSAAGIIQDFPVIPLLDTPSGPPRVVVLLTPDSPRCCPRLPVVPAALDLWPLLCFTCELAARFSVASPPLQDEEVVAPLGHPQLQSVFQQNFLRV